MIARLTIRHLISLEEAACAELLLAAIAAEVFRVPDLTECGYHLQQT